ncbi:iron ABC transporter permease protein [methanogenic archaeon mixed culture ISO4-G1]|nr:iron ABC transporter permease protein [methanogenic archaeon mixed culture ISO4-G1]
MKKYVFNLATIILLMAFSGVIVLAIMNNKGIDPVIIWSTAGLIVSITCIICGCVIYNERTSGLTRYVRKYLKAGDGSDFFSSYRASVKVKLILILLLLVAAVFMAALEMSVGINYFEITDVFRLIWQHLMGAEYEPGTADWWADLILWNARLPRVLVAIIAGMALAIGGAVMQSVVKNPLADPYTTGISSGAVFGVCLGLILGLTVGGTGQFGLILNAFIFSLIPATIMILVSRISSSSPVTIILVGTAVSSIFGAFTTLIMSIADETSLKETFVWEVGSLSGASWSWIPLMFTITLIGSIFLYLTSSRLNLLMAGDNEAKALGLNVDNYRMMCLILLSFMTASVVSYVGIIGFLGLVTPHIVRMFFGSNTRYVIPASAILGAIILLIADFISINIGINDLPVGVVMSFIGGPIFLLLVIRDRQEMWD